MDLEADIVVVGGGPSGVATAVRLARLGHSVLLVEAAAFPRPHVGEALGPGVRAQLDFLGLSDVLNALPALRFSQASVAWGSATLQRRAMDPRGMTVDRGRFDRAMLAAARRAGVRVLQPATAHRACRGGGGAAEWRVAIRTSSGPAEITARFVVDAAGRNGFLARDRLATSPPTVAVYAYWNGGAVPAEPRVIAGRDHWIWGSPVPGLGFNAMLLTDRAGLRARHGSLTDRYRAMIAESGLFGEADAAVQSSSISVCNAATYVDRSAAGGSLKVGEAAFTLDPLSSTGVQKAIQTGVTAAVVINTILRRPQYEGTALEFYLRQQDRAIAQHAAWTGEAYREDTRYAGEAFWLDRSSTEAPLRRPEPALAPRWAMEDRIFVSPHSVIRQGPVLADDFIVPGDVVEHPGLGRPIAFVGGVEVAPLLRQADGLTALNLIELIRRGDAPGQALRVMNWLVSNRVVEVAGRW